jgi:hypothetical protein
MQIDWRWLTMHNACQEGIDRFCAWAEDEPQTLSAIAEHHDNAYDLAWLIDQVASEDIRQDIACRIAGEAAAEMRHCAGGAWMLPYAKITMDNIRAVAEAARAMGASALSDLCAAAARGAVSCVLYNFVGGFTTDEGVPKWIDTLLRNALRTVHGAQTCAIAQQSLRKRVGIPAGALT